MILSKSTLMALASLALASVTMTSCASGPVMKTFEFDAIDTTERQWPCLIVVDDDWTTAIAQKQVLNVGDADKLVLTVPFTKRTVAVLAVPLDETGEIPKSKSAARNIQTTLQEEERPLMLGDPMTHMFILNEKRR